MPVLVEGTTWVARTAVLERRFQGGPAAFAALVPPGHRTSDGEVVAVSFEDARSSRLRLQELEVRGLAILRGWAFADVAVLHHRFGSEIWCPWLELAGVPVPGGGRVLAARAAGSVRSDVEVPPEWRFGGSRTQREGIVELAPADRPLRFLRREAGAAVYLDRFEGREGRVRIPDPPARVVVETAAGARHEVLADVVRGGRATDLGLMHRDQLDPDAGMLFVFGEEEPRGFWMKNTLIPLDMLFVNREGTIVHVVERAVPMTTMSCASRHPCSAVLEVNGGWAAARRVAAGDRVGTAEAPALEPRRYDGGR